MKSREIPKKKKKRRGRGEIIKSGGVGPHLLLNPSSIEKEKKEAAEEEERENERLQRHDSERERMVKDS